MFKHFNFRTVMCVLVMLVGTALHAQDSKTTLVTPPTGATSTSYVMTAVAYGEDAIRQNLNVIFAEDEVFIQGISKYVPEGWVHGTLSNTEVVFDTPQLLGNYEGAPHYFLGADTNTGDVSGLRMIYDAATKSFTSYDNNWILLTPDYTQVSYIYNDLLNTVSILPASIAGDDPSVTPPAGLQTKSYELHGYIEDGHFTTTGTVQVGRDGDDFYFQGIYPGFRNSWAKGTLDEKGRITFPEMQYLGNYHGLYDLHLTGMSAEGFVPFCLEYNEAKNMFVTPADVRYVVNCGDEEYMAMMNLYDLTIKPSQGQIPAQEYVELPDGATTTRYMMSAKEADTNSDVIQNVQVSTVGNEVYVLGLSADFPDVWVKGIRDHEAVTFAKNQFFGIFSLEKEYPIWLGGGDSYSGELLLGDFALAYDETTGIYTQPEFNYLVINASYSEIYHFQMLKGVTLTPIDPPSGIDNVTAGANSGAIYSLDGKRHDNTRNLKPGIYVRGGKKLVVK